MLSQRTESQNFIKALQQSGIQVFEHEWLNEFMEGIRTAT